MKARNYFVVTSRPDGRPQAMPIFSTSSQARSRKAQNLAANPRCVVCPDRGDEAVIVEGVAQRVRKTSPFKRVSKVYREKYSWSLDPSEGLLYAVGPRVAFGFIDRPDEFTGSATRWRF